MPEVDARLLLQHVLGVGRAYLHAHAERPLTAEEAATYGELLDRRAQRLPLPYVIGSWEFLGLPFRVTPAVLIPRPETETLVETVAARIQAGARVLDVGTGTGCVAIGVARLRADVTVVTLDISAEAAAVARENAAALGVADRVAVRVGAFPEAASDLGSFHAVVSNPPYIPSHEVDRLAPEQTDHEPRLALDGGVDGLDLIRHLVTESRALLHPGGLLAMEVMQGQAPTVGNLLQRSGWSRIETVNDLSGIERVVTAVLP